MIQDDDLAKAIGLMIEPDRNLPDLILADLGPEQPLLVFVEVVASAGPISESRRSALMAICRRRRIRGVAGGVRDRVLGP